MSHFGPVFIFLSSLLPIISSVIYVKAIFEGKAKPHRTTCVILLLITLLTTLSLFAQQDRVAVWLAGVSTFQSLLVFGASLKWGMGGWGKIDLLCLIMALLGILLWQTTKDPVTALYAAIAADFIGVVPTLIKTFHSPKTEILAFYFLDSMAAFFSLLAIESWTLQGVSYPVYLILINVSMVTLIGCRQPKA